MAIGIGDFVYFKNIREGDRSIYRYKYQRDGIPDRYIQHGSTIAVERGGAVVDTFGPFAIVKYATERGYTQLGFLFEDLYLREERTATPSATYRGKKVGCGGLCCANMYPGAMYVGEEIKNNNTKNKNMASMIDKVRIARMSEPQKTFVKAGIANMDGQFNDTGAQLFNDFLVDKFGAEFKEKVVDPILAEQKAEAKG